MIKEIKKKRLRYIVPFAFEAGEQEVAGLCEKLTGNSGEVNWVYEPPKEKEQDIYQLFEDTFRPNRKNHENIGFSLKLTGQDATGEILRIRYRRGDELPEYGFHISEAGLYLFRTGIGLFWYDDKNSKYNEDGSKKPNYVAEFLLEQEEKLSTALGVLSLLAIISGFSDGFGFVDQMTVYFRGTGWTGIDYVTHIGIFILVLLIAFFAVKSVGKVLVRMTRDEIRKRRERKNK